MSAGCGGCSRRLTATILGSGAPRRCFFSPQQLIAFAVSAVAATFSVSNVLFWLEADYFDALATTKPLLHTWSLGVEEQFYLVWPALLFVVLLRLPRGAPVAVLAALSVASVALAEHCCPATGPPPSTCCRRGSPSSASARSWSGRCASARRRGASRSSRSTSRGWR